MQQILGLKKGDVYNGVVLKKRIADTSKPDGNDMGLSYNEFIKAIFSNQFIPSFSDSL